MANNSGGAPIIVDSIGGSVATRTLTVSAIVLTAPTNNASYLLLDAQSKTCFAIDSWNQGMQNMFEWSQSAPLVIANGMSVASCSAGRILIYTL